MALQDSYGTIQESYRYNAFGEEQIFSYYNQLCIKSPLHNPWRYQSKRKALHLINFGRRFYDPTLGRWLSCDPKGFSEGPNLYQFLLNAPLTHSDLYGLEVFTKQFKHDIQRVGNAANYIKDHMLISMGQHLSDGQIGKFAKTPYLCKAIKHYYRGSDLPHIPQLEVFIVGTKLIPGITVISLNGIWSSRKDAQAMGQAISDALGGLQVRVIYDPSKGRLADLINLCRVKLGEKTAAGRLMDAEITQSVDAGNTACLNIHSRGAGITKNVVEDLPSEYAKQLEIATFGGVAIIGKRYGKEVNNYLSKKDLPAHIANGYNIKQAKKTQPSHVHFLEPATTSLIGEHAFLGSTYQQALQESCNSILERYQID